MKINKNNPRHLIALTLFGINSLIALLLRPIMRFRCTSKVVVLYGHKLSGNLLAIHNYWIEHTKGEMDFIYLTMDKAYHLELKAKGTKNVLATNPLTCISLLVRADAVISSHGLHVIDWMVGRTNIKFYDVWHGIPFKGFDADDFRLQHRFDETWVTSPMMAGLYIQRFGFDPAKVKVTGYPRTDQLVQPQRNKMEARKCFQLRASGKVVLFAPTWQQDSSHRSIYPFGVEEQEFLDALNALARANDTTIIIRAHLNSHGENGRSRDHIVYRPYAEYPDTEALLLACDVLVCDWSSIAFDWLLLGLPTVFLEVPPPFAKGFSLGPEYRFGRIARGMDEMLLQIETAIQRPRFAEGEPTNQQLLVRSQVYGEFADGEASKRCFQRLQGLLSNV